MENKISIIPESKEHWLKLRHSNINSTEISALFGCSPYMTEFELWHLKRSEDYVSIEETEVMRWGSRLESAIALGAAAEKGWTDIAPMKQYLYFEDIRLGSSFDFVANGNEIVEIKNVSERAYAKNWTEDEAAPHVELQIQTQLLVSGFKKAHIVALVGGNTVKVIERDFLPAVGESILKKVKQFWERTDEPRVDFERDAEFIRSLYQKVSADKILQADDSLLALALQYNKLRSDKSLAENKMKAIQAQMLMMVGDAEKVKHEKFNLSLSTIKESVVAAHTRASRRDFRLTMRGIQDEQV